MPKLSWTKVRQTLSNLTLLLYQTKTAIPNWFRHRSFAVLNSSVRFSMSGAVSEPDLICPMGKGPGRSSFHEIINYVKKTMVPSKQNVRAACSGASPDSFFKSSCFWPMHSFNTWTVLKWFTGMESSRFKNLRWSQKSEGKYSQNCSIVHVLNIWLLSEETCPFCFDICKLFIALKVCTKDSIFVSKSA